MPQMYALVTITGRVYVDQDDIDQLLEAGEDENGNKVTEASQAFEILAMAKISDMLPASDTPFKHYETEIDMKTLKSN